MGDPRGEEIQEIYEVLRRWHPDRSVFDLWKEALLLHQVRFATEVRPPPDARARAGEQGAVNVGRTTDLYTFSSPCHTDPGD